MTMRALCRFFLPLSVVGVLLTAGCSVLPEPQTDPTRFYVLSTMANGAPQAGAPVVQLREVELASYLKARAIVVRKGDHEIEFREFARWGEALEMGIERVLREELVARGAASAVVRSAVRRDHIRIDYTLAVRVLAAEGAGDGAVTFRAIWELATADAKPATVARGDYHPTDLRWDGKTEASLAAQLSHAVAGLAGEIGKALAK